MLDYSIIGSLAPSYHLGFMIELLEQSSLAEINLKDLQLFSKQPVRTSKANTDNTSI
jgi:hypothetical protein